MSAVSTIFLLVYLGMLLGGLPFLQLDRTGIALLGAIALLVGGAVSTEEAVQAVHLPTLILLFSFMVVAAQLRLGGFYDWLTERIGRLALSPPALLAVLILAVAALSAVFSNDVVCLAVAPVLIDLCLDRRLNPMPFLLGLACAANIGSAATLIGNPQNMLIGSRLALSFSGYLWEAAVPVAGGLVAAWLVIAAQWRGRWAALNVSDAGGGQPEGPRLERHPLDAWQAAKGCAVAAVLFVLFLFSGWPREMLALGGAGILLLSRKLHSRHMLGLVDWEVLVLFIGLFIVNRALEQSGLPQQAVEALAAAGLDLRQPPVLFGATLVLGNLVSNVPAIMLLLPFSAPQQGALLALASTFSGNLLIVGSVANIIVVAAAARRGIRIGWKEHALTGIPVTLLTLALAALWLLWLG